MQLCENNRSTNHKYACGHCICVYICVLNNVPANVSNEYSKLVVWIDICTQHIVQFFNPFLHTFHSTILYSTQSYTPLTGPYCVLVHTYLPVTFVYMHTKLDIYQHTLLQESLNVDHFHWL